MHTTRIPKLMPGLRYHVLACALLSGACQGPAPESPSGGGPAAEIDFSSWELKEKEELLERLLQELRASNGSSLYNLRLAKKYEQVIDETLGGIKDAQVLEIGPGRNLALGVIMVLRGARRYSAVDIYQHPELYDPSAYHGLYRLTRTIRWRLVTGPDDLLRVEGDRVHLDPDRIEWLYPYESYNFPKEDNTVDFVFSHAGFEHFNEPRKTIERIFQVLRPGGTTAHHIDLRDHEDFSKPFAFLRFGTEGWRARFTAENLHEYTNQWRAVDFRQAFEAAGFEIVEDDRKVEAQVTEELKSSFHTDFQDYSTEELSETQLWIVARKPEPNL